MADAFPVILVSIFNAVLHGGIYVVGFAILKSIRNWGLVVLLALGMATLSVAATFSTLMFQGWERASQMIVPGGELFAAVGLPMVITATVSMLIILTAAYGLFVEPGKHKND
jgi:hypothetical protein